MVEEAGKGDAKLVGADGVRPVTLPIAAGEMMNSFGEIHPCDPIPSSGRSPAWNTLAKAGAAVACSLLLHLALGLGLEPRLARGVESEMLVLLEFAPPPPVAPVHLPLKPDHAEPSPKVRPAPARSRVNDAPPVSARSAASLHAQAAARSAPDATSRRAAPRPESSPARSSQPVVLANESGRDTLKHGAEARFMHGVATEEFVEDNYVGAYYVPGRGTVWIEDDRAGSGHLILHDDKTGFRRSLFRFNRFIYVYGEGPDSPAPVLGSVTFLSDGSRVHQFIWQHNSTQAYYPSRR